MSEFIAHLAKKRAFKKGAVKKDIGSPEIPISTPAPTQTDLKHFPDRDEELRFLASGNLFNSEFYRKHNSDVYDVGFNLLEHFYDTGFREGRKPNYYFDPSWYLGFYGDVVDVGVQPLVHFARHGDQEGRRPSVLFDTEWYRVTYNLPPGVGALEHYLSHCTEFKFSPLPDFDIDYYRRNNPDVVAASIDPFEHYVESGVYEGRSPSEDFDVKFYIKRYLPRGSTENPFLHYLAHKHEAGVLGRMPDTETTIAREVKKFSRRGPEFEAFAPLPPSATREVKLLAYYLPQFHAFPENDRWWGNGFTEWTNVSRGLPRFRGHVQPCIPRDLGFYRLDDPEAIRRQVEMAKAAGLFGFVFYYYWFNGKRLLEKPLEILLQEPSIEMPFAVMWANENWTRRWDGAESEILISQDYRPGDDVGLVEDFARHFRDARYIRLQGRPLLMIYRPGLIPRAKEVIGRWRSLFEDMFDEKPIILMAQGFGDLDPAVYGLDGAIEFPPHKLAQDLPERSSEVDMLDPDFSGNIFSYDDVVANSLNEPSSSFPLIKTVIPHWDNDARRQGSGMIIHGSTPKKYKSWLTRLVARTRDKAFFGERIVCVNAWNEWAEGAYLEPDQYYGSAYLNASARAVAGIAKKGHRLLLVGHDAHPHGAQELLLNIGRSLKHSFGVDIEYLLLEGGPLEPRYEAIAHTTIVNSEAKLSEALAAATSAGISRAIVNTTASARFIKTAAEGGIECLLLVHELPRIIRDMKLTDAARLGFEQAKTVIFPAQFVRDQVLGAIEVSPGKKHIVSPQGIYKRIVFSRSAREKIRKELGVADKDRLVICVGYADLRKGFDLFVQLWRLFQGKSPRVHLCWVGGIDKPLEGWLEGELSDAKKTGTFHMVGFTNDVASYFCAADAFALTSREDPFPSVALEALSAGLEVVAFQASGGIPEMLSEYKLGAVVPYGNIVAMATALKKTFQANGSTILDRSRFGAVLDRDFRWTNYVGKLLDYSGVALGRVSVAVPNYNYARYMPSRFGSIFAQTYPVREIIAMDDRSSDNSVEVIASTAAEWNREIQLVVNEQNSGSVFAQWHKAAEMATGEFIWIAEADDLSDPKFLEKLLEPLIADSNVKFAFSDSSAVDADGALLGHSYKDYYSTVEPEGLAQSEVFDAKQFVGRFLSQKNLILNVSAVVWRRDALCRALEACGEELKKFKMAGDWRLYLQALSEPDARVAYNAEPLNVHRRHAQSVTHSLNAQRHIDEIKLMHGFAQKQFALPAEAMKRQTAYIQEVSVQLGVAGPAKTAKRNSNRNKTKKS